jgi:hypothetical protein
MHLKRKVNSDSGSRSLEYVDELNDYELFKYHAFKELVIISLFSIYVRFDLGLL